jgi:integrase|tara:strand:+ start:1169 stop:2293 length:1125 start_codon:yes stop_codon:yes gene_type:complete
MDKKRGLRAKNGGIEIRYSHKGTSHSYFLNKPWNPTNILEASRLRTELKKNQQGKDVKDYLSRTNPFFWEVAHEYMELGIWRKSTRARRKSALNTIWLPLLGDMRIKDITVKAVRFADNNAVWKGKGTHRTGYRNILSNIFQLAIEHDYIEFNPATKLKTLDTQNPKIDPFNTAEKRQILSALSGQAYVFYVIAFDAGLRTGEILGLKRSDFVNGEIRVERAMVGGEIVNTKTGKERDVLCTPRLLEAIRQLPTNLNGHMWVNDIKGNQIKYAHNYFNPAWDKAIEQANVRYRRPYNTRHTYASIGLSAGSDSQWLANQLGHSLRTFFTTYAKYQNTGINQSQQSKILAFENSESGKKLGQASCNITQVPDLIK